MNLRFWGGWFLAIAGISVLLTMGCEKGALGVKPATVVGKIVDQENPAIPVANAMVRMISKEAVTKSEVKQGLNFMITTTNANGVFIFENVQPDNVLLEYSANGYNKAAYPPAEITSTDEEGNESNSAKVEAVYVKSGSTLDLGYLPLQKISNPLPTTVTAKIDLVDAKSLKWISKDRSANDLSFTLSFNGQPYTMTADEWRNTGVTLNAENSFAVMVRHEAGYGNPPLYVTKEVALTGSSDIYSKVELEPVTYDISIRCVNVPDYIGGSVVNVFAEVQDPDNPSKPPQILESINLGTMDDLQVLSLPGLAMPVELRMQIRGYEDEVLVIKDSNLKEGAQGNYRVDIDFLRDDSVGGVATYETEYDPTRSVGLYDNMKRRDVAFVVAGEDFVAGNSVAGAVISSPHYYPIELDPADGVCRAGNLPVGIIFRGVAIGYDTSYNITIAAASGSYNLSSSVMVTPEIEPNGTTIAIGVNAKRP
ncbi:MAG: carboxypeptidase regulatory-like domain-containing protein [Erysipelotrichia bacterium]|nr:carboxypeptidase regulatory-like domain-containing protein [Erysipelotrichia bacterium]